jgi:hypothetical protein
MLAGPKTRYARQREKCYRVQCERKRAAPSEAVQREAALTATGWGRKSRLSIRCQPIASELRRERAVPRGGSTDTPDPSG